MLSTILSALGRETDREHVIDSLLTLQQCFSSDYEQIIKAFSDLKGVHVLEQVIVPFTEDIHTSDRSEQHHWNMCTGIDSLQ